MNQAMRVERFPLSRVGTFDVGVIGGRKHQIVGLLEADVTAARRRLRVLRREGGGGSFTAWLVKTVADTVEEMPQVHGVRLGRKRSGLLTRAFYHLPQLLRLAVMNGLLRSPRARKETMGTVIVTSIASDIRFPGWIIPRTMHNLAIGLGSVVRKPWVVGDGVLPREVLNLTVLLDHDVVDGAPAARFGSRLIANLENAVVLPAE